MIIFFFDISCWMRHRWFSGCLAPQWVCYQLQSVPLWFSEAKNLWSRLPPAHVLMGPIYWVQVVSLAWRTSLMLKATLIQNKNNNKLFKTVPLLTVHMCSISSHLVSIYFQPHEQTFNVSTEMFCINNYIRILCPLKNYH